MATLTAFAICQSMLCMLCAFNDELGSGQTGKLKYFPMGVRYSFDTFQKAWFLSSQHNHAFILIFSTAFTFFESESVWNQFGIRNKVKWIEMRHIQNTGGIQHEPMPSCALYLRSLN